MREKRSDPSVARGAVAAATAPRRGLGRLGWILIAAAAAVASWAAGAFVAERRADAGAPVTHLTHVHGMDAPAWAGGALLVGTHTGLVRWSEEEGWRTVGGARHDLMGIRADPGSEGVLYGGGHPDLRTGLPNPLGLIVSRDGGRRWTARSLGGVSDLHALAVLGGEGSVLLAWDALANALLRSVDGGATWATLPSEALAATGGVLALDGHPRDPQRVRAATADGLWQSDDGGGTWRAAGLQGSVVTAVRQLDDGTLWSHAIDPAGGLRRSDDGGTTWARVAAPIGSDAHVTAIAADSADPDLVYLATSTADVLRSADGGGMWTPLVVAGAVQ